MAESVIPVFKPVLPETSAIGVYLERAARSGKYSNWGPLVTSLEERLADHFGVHPANVAMCTSGTTALEGALATAADTGVDWELPAWTFTATPGAALRAGKKPHFVDVDLDQRAIFGAETIRAIDVLPFGAGPTWERATLPLTLVVDAAASFDSTKDFSFPSKSSVGVIVSLHATKSLPAGEGGVFFSNDRGWVDQFRQWANFGMWGSRVSQFPGTNGKMSEFTAAVAHAALDAWPDSRARWIHQSKYSYRISTNLDIVSSRNDGLELATPYWNIQLKNERSRVSLESYLTQRGVETRRWWGDGCHKMPAYEQIGHRELPRTEKFSQTILGLPFHLSMSISDFERIEHLLETYFAREN